MKIFEARGGMGENISGFLKKKWPKNAMKTDFDSNMPHLVHKKAYKFRQNRGKILNSIISSA